MGCESLPSLPIHSSRLAPNFNHLKSSLSFLIRDTEKNLNHGVFGTTDPLLGAQFAAAAPIPALQYQTNAKFAQDEKEDAFKPRSAVPSARVPFSIRSTSPPLEGIDASVDLPSSSAAAAAAAAAGIPVSYAVGGNPAAPPMSAMSAFQMHSANQDTLAAVSQSAKESAEAVLQLQGMLGAFKTKMRAAFDANMQTLDKKVRLIRRDILGHISATVAELERRMIEHLAKNGTGGTASEEAQASEAEFRKNTQEELLYLKSEFQKLHFLSSERQSEQERFRRGREMAFNSLQTKTEENESVLMDLRSTVFAVEKENGLLRSEIEQMKSKFRRELTHVQNENQSKYVELNKMMLDMKKTMEGMLTREENKESDRLEQHQLLVTHVHSSAQSYLDEQLHPVNQTMKTIKRQQLMQQEEMERMRKDVNSEMQRSNQKRRMLLMNEDGSSAAASADASGLDSDEAHFLSRSLTNLSARVDTVERNLSNDRQAAADRISQMEAMRNLITATDAENKSLYASSSRALREDINRVEREAATRESFQRNWREEMNTWSRNLEQTILNLKYSVNSSIMVSSLSASQSAAGGTAPALAASSSGVGFGTLPAPAPTLTNRDVAGFFEHPAPNPLSQALVSLENRTSERLKALENEMTNVSNKMQIKEAHAAAGSISSADLSVQSDVPPFKISSQLLSLEQLSNETRTQQEVLKKTLTKHMTDTNNRINDVTASQRALEKDTLALVSNARSTVPPTPALLSSSSAEAPTSPHAAQFVFEMLDARLSARMDSIDSSHKHLSEQSNHVNKELREHESRLSTVELKQRVQEDEIGGLKEGLKRQAALQTYQHQLHVATTGPHGTPVKEKHEPKDSPTSTAAKPMLPRTLIAPSVITINSPSRQGELRSGSLTRSVERVPDSPVTHLPSSAASKGVTSGSIAGGFDDDDEEDDDDDEEEEYEESGAVIQTNPAPAPIAAAALASKSPLSPLKGATSAETLEEIKAEMDASERLKRELSPVSARGTGSTASTKPSFSAAPRHPGANVAAKMTIFDPAQRQQQQPAAAATATAAPATSTTSAATATSKTQHPAKIAAEAAKKAQLGGDDFSSSEDESDEEDIVPGKPATAVASVAKPSTTSVSVSGSSSGLPPLQSSASPTASAGGSYSNAPSYLAATQQPGVNDEDHTGGVPHSVLSRAIKQRYLEMEQAGQVDGEAEIDEDSLYDPDADNPDSGRASGYVSERARRIAEAHAAKQQHKDVDEDDYEDDLEFDDAPAGQERNAARDAEAAERQQQQQLQKDDASVNQSLNSHYQAVEQHRTAQVASQYHAAHRTLQQRDQLSSQTISDDDEEDESETSESSAEDRARRPLGSSLLAPGFHSPHRVPIPAVAELSPLGKPGSLRSPLAAAQSSSAQQLPGFLKAPLGSTAAASASTATKPAPAVHKSAALRDEFDDEDEEESEEEEEGSDEFSASDAFARPQSNPSAGAVAASHVSDEDDLSSPRMEDLGSMATMSTAAAAGARSGAPGSAARPGTLAPRTPANQGVAQRQPMSAIHGHIDDDEMSSLFEPNAADEDPNGSVASFVSELDQMDISASGAEFNTSF